MATRTRSRSSVGPIGWRKHNTTGVVSYASYLDKEEYVQDVNKVNNDNNNFVVRVTTREGGYINYLSSSPTGYEWHDYRCDYVASDSYLQSHNTGFTAAGQPSDGMLAQQVIARTNPSRSSAQALEALADIREFGSRALNEFENRMKRLISRYPAFRQLKKVAQGNLMIQFGLTPLISDINVLLRFQDLVDHRVAEIDRLRTRGLRRTIVVYRGSVQNTVTNETFQSNGITIRGDVVKLTVKEISGHIRWYANSNWLYNDKSVQSVARKAITGYTLDPLSLYEIMPWSWLIDYFTNLGDFVKGSRNMFDAHHDQVRLMEHATTHSRSYNGTLRNATDVMSPFEVVYETKQRRSATPSLSAHIDFLTSKQWSILSSLAVLRGL